MSSDFSFACRLPPGIQRTNMHLDLTTAYINCQKHQKLRREYHPASPFMDFILELASEEHLARQSIVDSGFLDMLLCMYTCNFAFKTYYGVDGLSGSSRMRKGCSDVLLKLSQHDDIRINVSAHPISTLWSKDTRLSILWGSQDTLKIRQTEWEKIGSALVDRRLSSFADILSVLDLNNTNDVAEFKDLCEDIESFSR